MNRIEFMTGLAALLQDIPEIERKEAMQYYNDYFDDAGEENEQEVILELESPDKVAAKIKAGLNDQEDQFGEYSESGYTDTRFEDKEIPAGIVIVVRKVHILQRMERLRQRRVLFLR